MVESAGVPAVHEKLISQIDASQSGSAVLGSQQLYVAQVHTLEAHVNVLEYDVGEVQPSSSHVDVLHPLTVAVSVG
jgi:hypothetical protein